MSDLWPVPPIWDYFVPRPPVVVQYLPVGCICPPGANKECERPDCPRKDLLKEALR